MSEANFVINTLATPLSVRQTIPGASRSIFDWNGELVGTACTEEQAKAFITAVNAHDAIVAALRFQLDALNDLCEDGINLPASVHAKLANMRDDAEVALAESSEREHKQEIKQ